MRAGAKSDSLFVEHLVEPRFPRREHNAPARFTINALKSTRNEKEPTTREALVGPETKQWKLAIETQIWTPSGMDYWTVVDRFLKNNVLHSKVG